MWGDKEALLEAIKSYPEEDTPRLAFADYLTEQGECWVKCERCKNGPVLTSHCRTCSGRGEIDTNTGAVERAELIRVEVELARLQRTCDPNCVGRNRRSDKCGSYRDRNLELIPCKDCWSILRSRSAELIERGRGYGWWNVPGLTISTYTPKAWESKIGAYGPICFNFARGFINSTTLTTTAFVQHAAAIFSKQPITKVTLTDVRVASHGYQNYYVDSYLLPQFEIGFYHRTIEEALEVFSNHLCCIGRSKAKMTKKKGLSGVGNE